MEKNEFDEWLETSQRLMKDITEIKERLFSLGYTPEQLGYEESINVRTGE